MSGQNPREIAAEVLARVYHDHPQVTTPGNKTGSPAGQSSAPHSAPRPKSLAIPAFTEDVLDEALTRNPLSAQDRSLCQEIVYGVVRWQRTLDWVISQKTSHPPDKPLLQHLLRLGLYQIFWLSRIPNHAAVNETVEIAKRKGLKSQAGFINAVLRGFLREFDATQRMLHDLREKDSAAGYSHPEWLVRKWEQRWKPDEVRQLLDWNNTPPKTFARVNTLKVEPGKLLERWRNENVDYDFARFDWVDENLVFKLKSHPPLQRLQSFLEGSFYVQDPSTLLGVDELDPRPGETILDLCAAPGGKTTMIAQRMKNEGKIVAHDISVERLQLVRENCERLGIKCVEPALPAWFDQQSSAVFDRVLVDAPCSNTGVMRRRVDLRWRIQPEEITRLHAVQGQLLGRAAGFVRPGGVLVYSTCSLEPEENEQVVTQFLASNPWFNLNAQRQLVPFQEQVDGAFVAKLIRS